jgi:hypothetical protein
MIILANWSGFLYKKRELERYPGQIREGMGSMEGSILGLMSLLLGFTFSVAVSKFETRKNLIVEEVNIINTAILRCDMYPDSLRTPLRSDFEEYVKTRIAYYQAGNNEGISDREIQRAEEISAKIWQSITYHSNDLEFRIRSQQMIPVLNEMIDIVTTRDAMRISRIPPLIVWTLLILVLTAAFLLGSDYKGHKRNRMVLIGYAFVMTITLNLINELNHPREGLINLDGVEKKMDNLLIAFH